MNIVVIGNGAREEALIKAFARSNHQPKLFNIATAINPGILRYATILSLNSLNNCGNILYVLNDLAVDFVVIGPEAPLAAGLVDVLQAHNIQCIGPTKALALIESSKGFCRNLLAPSLPQVLPKYKVCHSLEGVTEWLAQFNGQVVIKADGLMSGKGVFVAGEHFDDHQQALKIIETLLKEQASVVLEEKLIGQEFSLISFSDGKSLIHMPLVQDNKRAYEQDLGPNTGGMGSVSYADHRLPFLTNDEILTAQKINEQTVALLKQKTGEDYIGFLYGGFMVTADGIKLIEYNARLGDPEAINLLGLLQTDLVDLCLAMLSQNLKGIECQFANQASVCKYIVPKGYPQKSQSGSIYFDITNPAYHCASIVVDEADYKLLGSRALACLGMADTVELAEQQAEQAASLVEGDVFYRQDIGRASLLQKRIDSMQALRNRQVANA
jgi:phosphoribosylamine--glycine ligase